MTKRKVTGRTSLVNVKVSSKVNSRQSIVHSEVIVLPHPTPHD